MKLILPLPPSVNLRKTLSRKYGQLVDSAVYKEYLKYTKEDVWVQAREQKWNIIKPTFEEQLIVGIWVFLPDKRRDATNVLKPLLDCLSEIIYTDDRWVLPRFGKIEIDKSKPKVEIIIERESLET